MSGVLALASDFIDHMANPAYGVHVNEDYGLRFAGLMEMEGFQSTFNKEASELKSAEALTSHGWIWLLSWARSQSLRLDENLLIELVRRWSNSFMQILVIDLATYDARDLEVPSGLLTRGQSINALNNAFLRRLLNDVITLPETEEVARSAQRDSESRDRLRRSRELGRLPHAENTLVALLQVSRPVTLEAAIALLNHRWGAQEELVDFYRLLREGLDEETSRLWKEAIDEKIGNSGGTVT